jgi:hypothetical protein
VRPHRSVRKRGLLARLRRVVAWSLAVALVAVAAIWWTARPATPDAFYAAPSTVPTAPGALIRGEAFTRAVPVGAQAWRMLYTTTRTDGAAAIASAIVMTATAPSAGPRPVIAWAHGTTGIAPGCAPSVMANPFAHVPAVPGLLSRGWAYVATDYVGLGTGGGHAYLVGDDAARAVLDAVRAARRLPGFALDNRVVVWGHSQGGNSALWTGIRAPDYAGDVNVLGVAALAPASDLPALVAAGKSTMFGKITSAYLLRAYAAVYPDVDAGAYTHARARLLVADLASRCVGGWETLLSALETALLPDDGPFARDPTRGTLGERLLQNTPRAPIATPVLLAQGQTDDLVLPAIQQGYVAARCDAGQAIDFRLYAGRDHLSLVAPDSPLTAELLAWTADRLAGQPATPNCGR